MSHTVAAFVWNSSSHVVKSCIGRAWHSSGNRMRPALLGNSNIDAKRSLFLLLAFYVEMFHYYFELKCQAEEQETRQGRWWFILFRLTTCLHLLLVLYGPIQAPPFPKTSANTTQFVNSNILKSSTYNVMNTTRRGRSYGLLLWTQ